MKKVKQVTLLVTRSCNLRCSYCYVRDYHGGAMTLETGKQIVQEVFDYGCDGYDAVEFTFLGGEPFCAFPLVRELSEWIWSKKWPKEYVVTAVTNGTLIKGDVREWLEENAHRFYICLSYDGAGDSQNKNRSNSAELIDLDFYRRNWPGEPVKMTISEDSVGNMAQDIIGLRERGIPVNDTFAGGGSAWKEASLKELNRQLKKLCAYELEQNGGKHSDLLSLDLRYALWQMHPTVFSCGAGDCRVTYDYDGQAHRCHLLSPLVLTEGEMSILRSGVVEQKDEKCRQCALDCICPTCDGNSYRMYGCFGRRDASVCDVFRFQAYYACRYQAKNILRKETIDEEDKQTLAAIRLLMQDRSWIPQEILQHI